MLNEYMTIEELIETMPENEWNDLLIQIFLDEYFVPGDMEN